MCWLVLAGLCSGSAPYDLAAIARLGLLAASYGGIVVPTGGSSSVTRGCGRHFQEKFSYCESIFRVLVYRIFMRRRTSGFVTSTGSSLTG